MLDLGTDAETGEAVRVRIGRFGPFVQVGEGGPGRTASLPEEVAPADLTVERAIELVRAKAEGPRALGADPATGQHVYVMNGRYGAYVQLGETPEGKKAEKPKRVVAAGRHDRVHGDARGGAEAAVAAARRRRCIPTTTSRSSPTSGASVRT